MTTILVALDGSTRARGVFDAAATLARALRARVVLYRALVIPPDLSAPGGSTSPDELPRYLEKEAHTEFLALKMRPLTCHARSRSIGPISPGGRSLLRATP